MKRCCRQRPGNDAVGNDLLSWAAGRARTLRRRPGVALYQDFRKFEKKSKAGAIQEIFFKMAGAAKKNLVFPEKIWDRTPVLGLSSPLI
jgi:hypothetical protein